MMGGLGALAVGAVCWWGRDLKDLLAGRAIAAQKAQAQTWMGTVDPSSSEKAMQAKKRAVYASGKYDEAGFTRLPPAEPGDWLWVVPEPGQTFEEYQQQVPPRRTAERHVIYLQPLGDFGVEMQATLETMREYAGVFFVCEARLLEPKPLPEWAYVPNRNQYDAGQLLGFLQSDVPADALAYVGITNRDLFARDLNFVFGVGSPTEPVGVYSLIRYIPGQDRENTLLRRALKVLNHEVGHILGLAHCIFYRCTMNGSNSLRESDRRPIHLCPVCREKLEWNLGCDRLTRYRALRDFYRKVGFERDAAFLAEKVAALERQCR